MTFIFRVVLTVLLIASVWAGKASAQIATDQFFADSTAYYVVVPNWPVMKGAYESTEFAKLLKKPEFKEFGEELGGQIESRFAEANGRFGITIEDIQGVAQGEVAMGSVVIAEGEKKYLSNVLVIDVRTNKAAGEKMLADIQKKLTAKGATVVNDGSAIGAVKITTMKLPRARNEISSKQVFYLSANGWVVMAESLAAMKSVGEGVVNGAASGAKLAQAPGYVETRKRCQAGFGPEKPHLQWYISLVQIAATDVKQNGNKKQKSGRSKLRALVATGWDKVAGVGGDLTFNFEGHEHFQRIFAYVEGTGSLSDRLFKSARMLAFWNQDLTDSKVLPGFGGPLANFATVKIDVDEVFRNAEFYVDEITKKPGTFAEALNAIKTEARGHKVDLAALAGSLGPTANVATENAKPITTESEKLLVGLTITDRTIFDEQFPRFMKGERFSEREGVAGGVRIWEKEDEEDDLGPPMPGEEEEEEGSDGILGRFKTYAVVPASTEFPGGILYASNDPKYLTAVIEKLPESIELAADYKVASDKINAIKQGAFNIKSFRREDLALELAYELTRQGKIDEADAGIGQLVNSIFSMSDTPRKKVDGKKLPADYEKLVAPSLGTSCWFMNTEENGWYISGFGLSKAASK